MSRILQEIQKILNNIGLGFDKKEVLFDQGQLATRSEIPLEVWKYPMKGDDRLVAFALRNRRNYEQLYLV